MILPKNSRTFFTIINQFDRGIRYSFGRFDRVLEPGIRLNFPFYHQVFKISTTDKVDQLHQLSLISSDNVTYKVDASVQYRVVNPEKAMNNVDNYVKGIHERSMMALRNTLSSKSINEVLQQSTTIQEKLLENLKDLEENWGVKVASIQFRDIKFDESMTRAMATRAEADRNAEAKIIQARADVQTAEEYNKAAKIYSENPVTLRLREFELLRSIAKEGKSTIYFVPSNVLDFGQPNLTSSSSGKVGLASLVDLLKDPKDNKDVKYQHVKKLIV